MEEQQDCLDEKLPLYMTGNVKDGYTAKTSSARGRNAPDTEQTWILMGWEKQRKQEWAVLSAASRGQLYPQALTSFR